jgi:hypothetical protein
MDARGDRRQGRLTRLIVALALACATALVASSCGERAGTDVGAGGPTIEPSSPASRTPHTRAPRTRDVERSREPTVTPSPTPSPTPVDPYALADGVYPAYVRAVDVAAGTVTVDVVQTFEGHAAVRAALEDGRAPWKARRYRYYPVYIRNENPLLRTLDVRSDAVIVFTGECETTTYGRPGLRELAHRALPFTTDWYYSLTMNDDAVARIVQHIAIPAC